MKKKSAKQKTQKRNSKKISKRISFKSPSHKTSSRKNPVQKLSELDYRNITNKPGVDSRQVINFLNSPNLKNYDRNAALSLLSDVAKINNFNLETVRSIRDGIDLMHGYRKREYDFMRNPSLRIRNPQNLQNPSDWIFLGTHASKWDSYRPGILGGAELRDKRTKEWYLATVKLNGNKIFVEKQYPNSIKIPYIFTGYQPNRWKDWRVGYESEGIEIEDHDGNWHLADAEVVKSSRKKTLFVRDVRDMQLQNPSLTRRNPLSIGRNSSSDRRNPCLPCGIL